MKNNNDNKNYHPKQTHTLSNVDYYLELHKLLNPEVMPKLFKLKSKKLDQIILIRQIYEYVYYPLNNKYNLNLTDEMRKKMMSKVSPEEAKELIDFILSLGIVKENQKVLYNDEQVEMITEQEGKIEKPKPRIDQNFKNYDKDLTVVKKRKKNSSTITSSSVLSSKSNKKNTKTNKSKSSSKSTKSIDHAKMASDKLNDLVKKQKDKILSKEEKPTKLDVEKIDNFRKRPKIEEEPVFNKTKKPEFIGQMKEVKKQKISVNTFIFNEKDKIEVVKKDLKKGKTIVDLKRQLKDNNPEIAEKIASIPDNNTLFKVEASQKIIDESGKEVKKEKVYSYNEEEEEKNKKIKNKK